MCSHSSGGHGGVASATVTAAPPVGLCPEDLGVEKKNRGADVLCTRDSRRGGSELAPSFDRSGTDSKLPD